jgi:hypothetical protein
VKRANRLHVAFSAASAVTVAVCVVACGSHGASMGNAGGGAGTGGNAGPMDAGVDVAAGPHATVRVADFARPLLTYLDVCFSTDALGPTTSWIGPMLRGTYESLQNSAISPYFDVPVGTRSVRFVLEDSPDCAQTLEGIPDFALDGSLAEGSRSTLLFGGTGFDAGTRALEIVRFEDEVVPADGPNSVRFINAAQAESAIDIYAYAGFGMKAPCTLVYPSVAYASAGVAQSLPGDGGPTDANGYAPLRGENLYDLTFASMGFVAAGASCDSSTGGGLYTTDTVLGQGAWTVFLEDEASTHILCRDDGTPNPFCTTH